MSDRMDITFKANLESGEAYVTDAMHAKIMELDAMQRADLFRDIECFAGRFYEDAIHELREDFDAKRAAAKKDTEQ